ncbi:MAG: STAS domain-containing protein [Solirubrobacterales bacterium]
MLAQIEERFDGPLTIERTRYGEDVIVLSLSGEFDLAVAAAGRQLLEPTLEQSCAMMVVDLTELEFMDSSGVSLLYELARVRPDKEALRLIRSRHQGVNKLLELTGVDSVITTVAT